MARDMTVGELMDHLREHPAYWSVVPFINGTAGIATGVRAHVIDADQHPVVLIGECDLNFNLVEVMRSGGDS